MRYIYVSEVFTSHFPNVETLWGNLSFKLNTRTLHGVTVKKALLLWNDIKSVLSLWIPLSPSSCKWQAVNHLSLPFDVSCFHLLPPFTLTPSSFQAVLHPDLTPTSFISPSVLMDLGRSKGKPRALLHTSWASTPRARDTPNSTV